MDRGVCKLIVINAGLKVLIAYPRDRKEIDEVLNRVPDIHQSRKYITSPCKYLFIFGPGVELEDFRFGSIHVRWKDYCGDHRRYQNHHLKRGGNP